MYSGRIKVAYFQVKRSEDGRMGLIDGRMWSGIPTRRSFDKGSIYRQLGDNMDAGEAQTLARLCAARRL